MNHLRILLFGIVGGGLGIWGSVYTLYLRDFEEKELYGNIIEATILFSFLGIIGALLSLYKTKAGAWCMLVSAASMIFTTNYTGIFGVVSLAMLLAASYLSFTFEKSSAKKRKKPSEKAKVEQSKTTKPKEPTKSKKKTIGTKGGQKKRNPKTETKRAKPVSTKPIKKQTKKKAV